MLCSTQLIQLITYVHKFTIQILVSSNVSSLNTISIEDVRCRGRAFVISGVMDVTNPPKSCLITASSGRVRIVRHSIRIE